MLFKIAHIGRTNGGGLLKMGKIPICAGICLDRNIAKRIRRIYCCLLPGFVTGQNGAQDRILTMPKNPHGQGHDTRYVRLQKNYCFACGRNNADGMRLKFVYDQKQDCFVCRFRLGKKFTGPPGHCHGGIIATILDEAMGKVNKLRQVVALTTQITVDYLKPVPLNQPLRVESHEVRVRGRRHVNSAKILNQKGQVLARSRGTFLAIDPKRMFAKFVEPA